jgi:hypothetical protein
LVRELRWSKFRAIDYMDPLPYLESRAIEMQIKLRVADKTLSST